jgi:hypothetical protein
MSQTPPPLDDSQRGWVRSLLIRLLRQTSQTLDTWANRLETDTPAASSSPLTNPLVWIGAIAVVVVAVFVVPQWLSQPTPPPEIAQRPQPQPVEPPPVVLEPELPAEPELPVEPQPTLEPELPEEPELPVEPQPIVEPEPESQLPSDLTAPEIAEPLEIAEPPLTPEQQLVLAVRSQIAAVAEPYEDNPFVTALQANFEADLLRVQLTRQWYDLSQSDREQLANELWKKAQSLDFSHVEILDEVGEIVARNPVVGDRAIVLRRSRPDRPSSSDISTTASENS